MNIFLSLIYNNNNKLLALSTNTEGKGTINNEKEEDSLSSYSSLDDKVIDKLEPLNPM